MTAQGPAAATLVYPATRSIDQADLYQSAASGAVSIADPYRWLEEDARVNADVAAWVAAQNDVSAAYLAALPGRADIMRRLTELFDYARYSLPEKAGGKYFSSKNDGLQNQAVFYVSDTPGAEGRVLIDPNRWSADGTIALAGTAPSPDGAKVAYLVQDAGSDWMRAEVLDTATGEKLADRIEWLKFSGLSWAKDGSGFYYSRYPAPEAGAKFTALNKDQKVYFHRLGAAQGDDRVVVEDPARPDVGWGASATEDGLYLVVSSWRGTDGNGLRFIDLSPAGKTTTAVDNFANNHAVIGNIGSTFFVRTDLGAPNYRIVAVDAQEPAPENWRNVIAEGRFPIDDASLVGGKLIVHTLEDARSVVRVHATDGAFIRTVALPGIGSVSGFDGEADDPETFYSFASFNRPSTIYRYDVATGQSAIIKAPALTFNPDDYAVDQVFYASTGGARVPMFVVRHKDVTANGARPVLLYGYGGFNVSLAPAFSAARLQWMEMGGVFALANIRGGGEYGRDWHDGGRLKNKQNVFDDFIKAAEALIDAGWTKPRHIAAQGGSNGGLLVGAVVNQRPDLFGAALPSVGVMDMLRFNQFTAGRFWVDDYGDPADPEMVDVLRAYSPLHNIRHGAEYPAILVTTADTDDRVVPGHSFKYAAALQAADTGPAPKLIRIETRAGHGAGTPISKIIEETADEWAFIARHTGLETKGSLGR
ncbi:MAG: prolyl oligopeptidase family serine peptidase [Parvularculaceae bacterium]|nr:prolyl oligopeptidase family serine peptidase [Parvularculaceae bacterium]